MSHINRRHFLGTSAAGGVMVCVLGNTSRGLRRRTYAGVPEGVSSYATMATLAGQEADDPSLSDRL